MSTLEAALPVVQHSRVLRASRAQVFEAWTKPEILTKWFGPAHMYCPEAEVDLRVGGAYRLDAHPLPEVEASTDSGTSAGRGGFATGYYTKIVADELLQFTWEPSWLRGEESLVTITLRDAEGGTEITLRHERFLPESNFEGYSAGWTGSLDKLVMLLESK